MLTIRIRQKGGNIKHIDCTWDGVSQCSAIAKVSNYVLDNVTSLVSVLCDVKGESERCEGCA